jgi:hypothetical protein
MVSPLSCRYQCSECAGKFRWAFDEPSPLFCPHCSAAFSQEEKEEFVPKAPLIRKPGNEIGDKVFRAMEEGSIRRADAAYEMAGGDRRDYNNMHITNMKDRMREGENAVIAPPPNPVQRFMQQYPYTGGNVAQIGMGGQLTPQGAASMAHTGIEPYAGARMAGRIQETHRQIASIVQANGEKARG